MINLQYTTNNKDNYPSPNDRFIKRTVDNGPDFADNKTYAIGIGGSNRTMYDPCEYKTRLNESTSVLSYMLYPGNFENVSKCIQNKFYTKLDLVDNETDLMGLNRVLSRCPQDKFNPNCKYKIKNGTCSIIGNSKFNPNTISSNYSCDLDFPIEDSVYSPLLCPPVHNNITKTGYTGLPPLSQNKSNSFDFNKLILPYQSPSSVYTKNVFGSS